MSDRLGSLKQGGLGLVGLTTIGAAMMSPVMGIYGNFGPIGGSVGIAVPLVFVAALIVSLPTAISYSVVCREIPSAGSAFSWIRKTTTATIATWVGLVMTAYYIICVVLQPMLFGLFWNDFLKLFGVANPGLSTWLVGVALSTLVAMMSTYKGVAISTRVSVAIIVIEVGVLLALSFTIVSAKLGAPGGLSFAPFMPSSVQGGLAGFSSAMVVGIMVYTGYDVVSTVAEETASPRALLPIATMLSLILVAII